MNQQIGSAMTQAQMHHPHLFDSILAALGIGSAGATLIGWIPVMLGIVVSLLSIVLLWIRIDLALMERREKLKAMQDPTDK